MKKKRVSDNTPLAEKVTRKKAKNLKQGKEGSITEVTGFYINKPIFEDLRWVDKKEFLRTSFSGSVLIKVSGLKDFFISFEVDPMNGRNDFINFLNEKTEFPDVGVETLLYGRTVFHSEGDNDYIEISGCKIEDSYIVSEDDVLEMECPNRKEGLQIVEKWINWIYSKNNVYSSSERQVNAVYEVGERIQVEVIPFEDTVVFEIPYGEDMFWSLTDDVGGGLLQNIEGGIVHIILRDIYSYINQPKFDNKVDGWVSNDNVWVLSTSEINMSDEEASNSERKSLINSIFR